VTIPQFKARNSEAESGNSAISKPPQKPLIFPVGVLLLILKEKSNDNLR
jgi:hypothetical protein